MENVIVLKWAQHNYNIYVAWKCADQFYYIATNFKENNFCIVQTWFIDANKSFFNSPGYYNYFVKWQWNITRINYCGSRLIIGKRNVFIRIMDPHARFFYVCLCAKTVIAYKRVFVNDHQHRAKQFTKANRQTKKNDREEITIIVKKSFTRLFF